MEIRQKSPDVNLEISCDNHLGFNTFSSIPRMRVGADEELDVLHARRKTVESGLFILQQGVGRNHNLPSAVPRAAADQAGVGEFLRHAAVEHRGIRHGCEFPPIGRRIGLIFAELTPGDAVPNTALIQF